MSKKSKTLLFMAGLAMVMSLVFQFAFATLANGMRDFTVGLSAALMFGVLLTWQKHRAQ